MAATPSPKDPARADERPPSRAGRKRDHTRDAGIREAALAVLAEVGYDGLTIDAVASRAGAARATVYRRWSTKADLVLDAVTQLSVTDVDVEHLPDSGSLRDDLVAMILPQTEQEQDFRTRVLAGLLALSFSTEPRLTDAAATGLEPWIRAGEHLIGRAVERGEYPPADVAVLARVVPMLCLARAAQHQPITREFCLDAIDGVIVPALRGGR